MHHFVLDSLEPRRLLSAASPQPADASAAAPSVTALSSSGNALSSLVVHGQFETGVRTIVRFTTTDGFDYRRSVHARASVLRTTVPVVFDPTTGLSEAARVKVAVYQTIAGRSVRSNPTPLRVKDVAAVKASPGTVTQAYLEGQLDFLDNVKAHAVKKHIKTHAVRGAIDAQIDETTNLVSILKRLTTGKAKAVTVATVGNQEVRVRATDFAQSDLLIAADLSAMAATENDSGTVGAAAGEYAAAAYGEATPGKAAERSKTPAFAQAISDWGGALGHWLQDPRNDAKAISVGADLTTIAIDAAAVIIGAEALPAAAAVALVWAGVSLVGAAGSYYMASQAQSPAEEAAWKDAGYDLAVNGTLTAISGGLTVVNKCFKASQYLEKTAILIDAYETQKDVTDLGAAVTGNFHVSAEPASDGTGTGTVTVSPTSEFYSGTSPVTVTATAADGSLFDSWSVAGTSSYTQSSGGQNTSTSSITFTPTADTTVVATFKDAFAGSHTGTANFTADDGDGGADDPTTSTSGTATLTITGNNYHGTGAYQGTLVTSAFQQGHTGQGDGLNGDTVDIVGQTTSQVIFELQNGQITGALTLPINETFTSHDFDGNVTGTSQEQGQIDLALSGTVSPSGQIEFTFADPNTGGMSFEPAM